MNEWRLRLHSKQTNHLKKNIAVTKDRKQNNFNRNNKKNLDGLQLDSYAIKLLKIKLPHYIFNKELEKSSITAVYALHTSLTGWFSGAILK